MTRLSEAIGLIESAREYTIELLNHVPRADWFRMPQEGVTHVAWQVGHLAYAEYRLTLERIRGARPDDDRFIPSLFLERFGRGSLPTTDRAASPPVDEIRRVFDAVHEQARRELTNLHDAVLDEPVAAPHPRFANKLGALTWCAQHEMVHAGQIGLLRRLLGSEPIR